MSTLVSFLAQLFSAVVNVIRKLVAGDQLPKKGPFVALVHCEHGSLSEEILHAFECRDEPHDTIYYCPRRDAYTCEECNNKRFK